MSQQSHDYKINYCEQKVDEARKEICTAHDQWMIEEDACDDCKRDIMKFVREKRAQEKKTGESTEEIIVKIKDARRRLELHREKCKTLRAFKKQKHHEMDEWFDKKYHYNMVKNGWRWYDHNEYGRIYYSRDEELKCIMQAIDKDETCKFIFDKLMEIRRKLNVDLTPFYFF